MNEKIILCYVVIIAFILVGMIWWLYGWTRRFGIDLDAVKKNTEIQVNKNVPVIKYSESNVVELKTEVIVPMDVYREDDKAITDYVTSKIAKDLATSIVPFIDIVTDKDFYRNNTVYHARIRVIGK